MFNYTTAEIIERARRVIRTLKQGQKRLPGNDALNDDVRQELFCFTADSNNGISIGGFLSRYIGRCFGTASEPEAVRHLAYDCFIGENNAADGIVFESYFFALAASETRIISQPVDKKLDEISWEPPNRLPRVFKFDPKAITKLPENTWLMPNGKNQPDYDAVFLRPYGVIEFLQITVSDRQDMNMSALCDLIERLRDNGHKIKEAAIIFILPDSTRACEFKVTKLRDHTRFAKLFKNCPHDHDELKKQIRIATLRF
jgi:hypothetical protein